MTTASIENTDVFGLSIRVAVAASGPAIGELWQRAGAAGLLSGEHALAVYHDYAQGPEGWECTVTVGTETPQPDIEPVQVPAQTGVRFDTDGSIEQVVGVWERVWRDWPEGGPRSFVADLERWTNGPTGPVAAEIFVGTR